VEILDKQPSYVVCRKAPGEISEHTPDKTGAPDLAAEMLGIPPEQVYVVHRLDRTTGGLLVFALSPAGAAHLSAQITNGSFSKTYLAAVEGRTPGKGDMQDLLYFDRGRNKSFVTGKKRSGVKEARLSYTTLATVSSPYTDVPDVQEISLCRIHLHTGRTHQIRVQFASRSHPLLGDGKYGSKIHEKGCSLLAYQLSFRSPDTNKPVQYGLHAVPLPQISWDIPTDEKNP